MKLPVVKTPPRSPTSLGRRRRWRTSSARPLAARAAPPLLPVPAAAASSKSSGWGGPRAQMSILSSVLHPAAASININKKIWGVYFGDLLPRLVKEGSDGNRGSSAFCDTIILQPLSKRIHYGKFVAEAKFQESPDKYKPAIIEQDSDKLMEMLTYAKVEENVKRRVKSKAMTFGQVVSSEDAPAADTPLKIEP